MASGIVRGRVRTRATATESHNMTAIIQIIVWQRHAALVTVYFFDIGHPCHDQLTPVKSRHLLTSITWPYRRLKFRTHVLFFWSWLLTECWFSIGLWVHVSLIRWKQGQVVRKPVNANPGLKVNRIIAFSSIQMFFTAFVLCNLGLLKLKIESQTIYTKLHRKVAKPKSKFYLILG